MTPNCENTAPLNIQAKANEWTAGEIPTLNPEEIASRYQKVSTLGKGAFGKAYLIKETKTGLSLVLKQIAASKRETSGEGAAREAALLATLNHPNIVRFCDAFWTSGGRLCLVMTYCDGGDLHSLLKRQSGELLPERHCLQMFVQICFAVHHIHQRKIIHRDLKTSNVFLMSDGLIKLGDFGISRKLERTRELARTMVGTPFYLSPEILSEQGYGFQSDIWSLGVILYEMTTLKHPFDAGNLHSLALRIMKGDFADPDTQMYSRDTRLLIRSMLKQIPETRPDIVQIIQAPFLQSSIETLKSKYPEYVSEGSNESVLVDSGQSDSDGSVLMGSVQIVRTYQDLSTSIHSSSASTVKYSGIVDDSCEYSADFEEYSDSSVYQDLSEIPKDDEEIDDLSNPDGIFNYLSSRIGEDKVTLLFSMIQGRIDLNGIDSNEFNFRDKAKEIIGSEILSSEEMDGIIALAEAALFLQNAY